MARSEKFIIPFLKKKSNKIELLRGENTVSFRKSSFIPEVLQIIYYSRTKGHFKNHIIQSEELNNLKLQIIDYNDLWIERMSLGFKCEIDIVIE